MRVTEADKAAVSESNEKKPGWKQKIGHELVEYWINVAYLFFFFGVFVTYRRLLLAEYHITYLHYGLAFFKALILAKVIMIGDMLRLGQRRFQEKPLILTTLFRTVMFTVWVGVFNSIELLVEALLHGEGLAGGIHGLTSNGYEVLARGLIVFCAFIPFFAFKELGRVLGERRLAGLFFRRKSATDTTCTKIEPIDDHNLAA